MAATRQNYRCSFCGKTQDQVRRLIAGPGGVYICDECVELCTEIIVEEHGYSAVRGGWRAQVRKLGRTRRPAQTIAEEQDPGDWLFDTLRTLGYTLVVGDDGRVTATIAATNEQASPTTMPQKIEGQVRPDGTIEWPDDEAVRKVLFHARIVELRGRV